MLFMEIKTMFPKFKKLEKKILKVIYDAFELPIMSKEIEKIIKKIDTIMLKEEALKMMPMKIWSFPDYEPIGFLDEKINLSIAEVEELFLQRFYYPFFYFSCTHEILLLQNSFFNVT